MELKETILDKVKNAFGSAVQEVNEFRDELALTVLQDKLLDICRFLKEDPELEFNVCEDVTAIDWAKRNNRFTLVYHIYSLKNRYRLRIKVNLTGETAESVSSIWPGANWYERETFDMYGITFSNHPDMRRMYMPEDFEYHPLRKEFPLMGIPGSLPLPKK